MLRDAALIAGKDLRIELRSRVITTQVLPFGLMVLFLFAFGISPDRRVVEAPDRTVLEQVAREGDRRRRGRLLALHGLPQPRHQPLQPVGQAGHRRLGGLRLEFRGLVGDAVAAPQCGCTRELGRCR